MVPCATAGIEMSGPPACISLEGADFLGSQGT